jgi:hypothetical protein
MRRTHLAAAMAGMIAMMSPAAFAQNVYTLVPSHAAAQAKPGLNSRGGPLLSHISSGRHISPPGRKPAGLIRQQRRARRSRDS